MTVLTIGEWKTNSEMIAEIATLGYFNGSVLDATWGRGNFWNDFKPEDFIAHDKYTLDGVDFRWLPHSDDSFDCVVLDPPYKTQGTPALGDFDNRFGIDRPMRLKDRVRMIEDGITECCRATREYLALKVQNQVVSGHKMWQEDMFTRHAEGCGMRKEDHFIFMGGYRKQDPKRRQVHSHINYSSLLIFRKV